MKRILATIALMFGFCGIGVWGFALLFPLLTGGSYGGDEHNVLGFLIVSFLSSIGLTMVGLKYRR